MGTNTLLIEIGTEELPPTAAKNLSDTFASYISSQLSESGFTFTKVKPFVTPRRLALIISDASAEQPEQNIERKGPAIKAAYDKEGQPTKAAIGFANSCGVDIQDLQTIETDKGSWLYFKSRANGKSIQQVLPEVIEQGLIKLPIPKPMRWGSSDVEFVRPIHWITVMYGNEVVACKIKGISSSNTTFGHRFHAPQAIALSHANDYQSLLIGAKVIADFSERENKIRLLLEECAHKNNADLNFSDALLEEVTNLVEWPTIIVGEFSEAFLDIPQEALVVTMQDAQRYFPLFSKQDGKLLPLFITIANIESRNPDTIKHGNERVIKPRFDDAKFFWERDKQKSLESRTNDLQGILFEKQLGSLLEKSQRVSSLTKALCKQIDIDNKDAARAALLCKADLVSDMVNEFPKLQGIMGRYYAHNDNESVEVATAIGEHYQPLQSGSSLPSSIDGQVVALCDRIDTLVGIFATGKKPSGVKDPYALRRAALGVIRISIERNVDYDLLSLLVDSASSLDAKLKTSDSAEEVFEFIIERLRGYLIDQGVNPDTFEAVRSLKPTRLLDFNERIDAVQTFRALPEADSLAAANKRISNILKKTGSVNNKIDSSLFSEIAEQELYKQLSALEKVVTPKFVSRHYAEALTDLAQLRSTIDTFFDDVMVMDERENIRDNRIALLANVRRLFTTVADISLLQS
ncbi:MAG: glycine--tRNA ligase subunit beta [Gammaproteobacteria bacterium]|nr:glycine--tRNA ligase subunit beta [Gammaproteobacteria bacterium]